MWSGTANKTSAVYIQMDAHTLPHNYIHNFYRTYFDVSELETWNEKNATAHTKAC